MKASLYALVYSLWYTLPDKIIPYARSGFENMTMILTLLSKGFIVQASDRRNSTIQDNKVQWCDDQSNKALVHKNQFVFAYTGQAKIPVREHGRNTDKSTIDWAAEQLSKGKNLDDAVNNLKYRATELMNSNQVRKLSGYKKRIAFVGAGFDERGRKKIRWPLRIMIENFIEEDGMLLDQPRDEFRIRRNWLENCDAALYIAGHQLQQQRGIEFARFLRRLVEHHAKSEKIGILLTRTIRETAKAMPEEEKTVGGNIMCIFVPQAYDDRDDVGMTVPVTGGILLDTTSINSTGTQIFKPVEFPSLEERIVILPSFNHPDSQEFDSPRFAYIPEDNRAQPYYSPVYVRPGKVMPTTISGEMSITFTPNPNPPADTPPQV
jgi:hypothetical protein